MMSRRRGYVSLCMIVLMLAVPWTAAADSNGRGGDETSEKVKITTQKQVDQSRVEIEIEFENLTTYMTYEYEITITRVDPDFAHEIFTGDFTTGEADEYTITEHWPPDQEGPYTVHSSLIYYESVIATGTNTFGWGDVANNSQEPNVEITPDPELTHYDLFGNTSLAEAVTIELDAVGTETGAAYKIRWKLYTEGVEEALIGLTENAHHRNFVMSNLIDYFENNSNFTLFAALLRIDGDSPGQASENELGNETWTFTIGKGPEVTIDPVISGCTDLNATNYDSNATVDDGSCVFLDTDGDGVFDHLEIEGCTDKDAVNFNQTATEDDGTCEYLDTDGDGVCDADDVCDGGDDAVDGDGDGVPDIETSGHGWNRAVIIDAMNLAPRC